MSDFIELRRVMNIVARRWLWLVVLTAVGLLMGLLISWIQTPVYQATTTVLVGDSITSSHVDRVDIQVSEALVTTYVQLTRRQPVLDAVVKTLGLKETWQQLAKQVEVNQIDGTQLIEINVEASSPDLARTIADEIVNQLILFSPTNSEIKDTESENSFNRQQIADLQQNIVNGQKRLTEIQAALNNSPSETQLADLQKEKANLDTLLLGWQKNYTDLLTLTESKRNPTQLSVIESAHSNGVKIRPRTQLNAILGGAIGLVLALVLAFVLDFLDDTYKTLNDFSQSEELNVLGSIRRIKGSKLSDKVVAYLHPHSPITESYRIIRSRIRFKPADKPTKSIMVTSSIPEEGKSLTAANLAVVFAQANYKTIVVDADLRHPSLHQIFDVDNEVGLGDMLNSPEIKIEECLKNTSVNNLRVLTSGMPIPDPSERLGSARMEEISAELHKDAEIVIFDSPPALVYADAIVLSRRMDGLIMVIRAGKSSRSAVNQTLFDLQNANANLLGIIFNQSPKSDTFSVNKAYMQERPLLSFPSLSVKKASVVESQFHDLQDLATPLSPTVEMSGLAAEVEEVERIEPELEQQSDVKILQVPHHKKRHRKHGNNNGNGSHGNSGENNETQDEEAHMDLSGSPVDLGNE